MTEPREITYTLRGRAYAALEWGQPGAGPLTIYLHGFLDHAGAWGRVVPRVGGWSLAFDQRGHGRSAWAAEGEDYFFPEYIADLDALVGLVGAPVRLVGHSMGGTVASQFAGARPDAVTALVLVDGLGLYDQVDEVVFRMRAFLDGVASPPRAKRMASVEEAAQRIEAAHGPLPEGEALALARRGTTPWEGGFRWAYDPRHRSRGALPYRQDHHRALLAQIRCPVLAIRPGSPVFQEGDVAALEGEVRDLRTVTIPGVGHMIHLQAPEVLAGHISTFFEAIRGDRPDSDLRPAP